MKTLRSRLSEVGVKRKFLNEVVLPPWWDDSIADSTGGFREATGYISSHLGFSLQNLIDPGSDLSFVQRGGVKFKKSDGVTEDDVCLATNYALGVARAVAAGLVDKPPANAVPNPGEMRAELLEESDKPWICLRHIIDAAWALGIPVIHLRKLPEGKKPQALATIVGERPLIVVFSGRKSPSWVAFTIAHELGHLHHRHIKPGQTLVDEKLDSRSSDGDESEANQFALTLLTGFPDLGLSSTERLTPKRLATLAKSFGKNYRIAPGVAALNYGFNNGDWALANGAVSEIEADDNAADDLKRGMQAHLKEDDFSEDTWAWIAAATQAAE